MEIKEVKMVKTVLMEKTSIRIVKKNNSKIILNTFSLEHNA